MPQPHLLITGAGGFVGRVLVPLALARGHRVTAILRTADDLVVPRRLRPALQVITGCDLSGDGLASHPLWQSATPPDVVIHLAARAHVMDDDPVQADALYQQANPELTARVAEVAFARGVRRMLLVSSIKAQGEHSPPGQPLDEDQPCRPEDAYGRSKRAAEQVLLAQAAAAGREGVVVRPPLVYGPGVKGNLARLIRLLARGLPLPLGGIHNRRSLIFVGNLADALLCCATHPAAAGRTYLVSDDHDLSTPELLRRLAQAQGRPCRLLSVAPALLRPLLTGLGQGAAFARLSGSLQLDISRIRRELGWQPPWTIDDGLASCISGDWSAW